MSPTDTRNPATMIRPIKITLGPEESEILTDAGASAFIVIGRGSYPHSAGRWELWIVPSTIKAVDSAVRVARGLSRESKPRTTKP